MTLENVATRLVCKTLYTYRIAGLSVRDLLFCLIVLLLTVSQLQNNFPISYGTSHTFKKLMLHSMYKERDLYLMKIR